MKIRRLCCFPRSVLNVASIVARFIFFLGTAAVLSGQTGSISEPAYQLISQRVAANRTSFYIYRDQDSGMNHGFPSGLFASDGNLETIHINDGCIDDLASPDGCSDGPNDLDRVRGTVMRISFDPQAAGNYAGVNFEEPENWGVLLTGSGYDARGASNIIFDARSPNGGTVQFGVGGCNTPFMTIPSTWTEVTVSLNSLSCTPDLSSVHILFAVATSDVHASGGATVLLDNIRFDPVPTGRQSALSFPLGNQTFGVVPQGNEPISSDQVLRNVTTIYESSLAELALLRRGKPQDLEEARIIADTFDYALHHDNQGDPLPVAPDSSVGLHNGYEDGDIALLNSQQAPKQGQAGNIRLSGFTANALCPQSGFCLMLDGATGGNNAFAIIALVAAFRHFGDMRYLNDAVTIGNWIVGNMTDASGIGYGGYFLGYADEGELPPKQLQPGKSTENNADIFAAFTALAAAESRLGNSSEAAGWTAAANIAGDFVMQMFDSNDNRFNAGTVPEGTPPASGICLDVLQKGSDVINTCDFLDSNTFAVLAMAGAPRYRNQIDWRQPIQYVLDNFDQIVTAGGQAFQGFNIVITPVSGPDGVAWEFTGQVVEAMRYVDKLYRDTQFKSSADFYLGQIDQAQASAPFGDGQGVVAGTVEDGDILPPMQQCLNTPFQCIAERVGLAATAWAILAEMEVNVFIDEARPKSFDIDGDGKSDIAVRRPDSNVWYVRLSGTPGSYTATQWGLNSDVAVPGDYDGDGKADIAVWRPGAGVFYVLLSGTPGSYAVTPWGMAADIPVTGDYDGDAKDDIAVWRPGSGTFYVLPSGTPGTYMAVRWGIEADIPVPGDYDGDGKSDFAVWRPGTGIWYVLESSDPNSYISVRWGLGDDLPTPGDYDEDGKVDISVFRPSTGIWYVLLSGTPGAYTTTPWGITGDVPVAGDYDGDGRTDIAVWRSSDGVWYVLLSGSPGSYIATQWGITTDIAVSPLTGILSSIP